MLSLALLLAAQASAVAVAQAPQIPQVEAPTSLPEVVRAFTLTQSPVRTGPNRASLGPVTVKRLITRVDVDQLAIVPVTPTRVAVSGALVIKVNGPKRPFVVTADMGVTESSCEGWFTPLAVPIALTVDFSEAAGPAGAAGVRAAVRLDALGLEGLPVAEHLVFCDLAGSSGLLLGAAVGWVEAADESLVKMYEDQLNAYLAGLPGLTLRPAQPPSPAPDAVPLMGEPMVY